MNRSELQELSEVRIKEARALFAAGLHDGAYYLAGYAIESAMKACIAKRTQQHDFPDRKFVNESHTHSLIELMRLSDLRPKLDSDIKLDPVLRASWTAVQEWSESSRYGRSTITDAEALQDAIENLGGGILPWTRRHW